MNNYSQLVKISQTNLINPITKLNDSKDLLISFWNFMLALMAKVERWDLRCDNFILHSNSELIFKELKIDSSRMWGADIFFTNAIHVDEAFATSNLLFEDNRHIALGIFPSASLKKIFKLKAFW